MAVPRLAASQTPDPVIPDPGSSVALETLGGRSVLIPTPSLGLLGCSAVVSLGRTPFFGISQGSRHPPPPRTETAAGIWAFLSVSLWKVLLPNSHCSSTITVGGGSFCPGAVNGMLLLPSHLSRPSGATWGPQLGCLLPGHFYLRSDS